MKGDLYRMKRGYINQIKALIRPHLWESNYGLGDNKVRLWTFAGLDDKGRANELTFRKLRGGYVLKEFCGFTEEAVITDVHMAFTSVHLDCLPVEDLRGLLSMLKIHFKRHEVRR